MKTESESTGWEGNRQCYGVIVHEDLPTEMRARRMWNQLAHEMGPGIRCSPTYQPAEWIKESLIFERAYQADIVIVSVHDLARFFFGAAEWLTDWLSVKSRLPRALFILHDEEENSQVVEFLRTITELAGVTLFSRGRKDCEVSTRGDLGGGRHHGENLARVA